MTFKVGMTSRSTPKVGSEMCFTSERGIFSLFRSSLKITICVGTNIYINLVGISTTDTCCDEEWIGVRVLNHCTIETVDNVLLLMVKVENFSGVALSGC